MDGARKLARARGESWLTSLIAGGGTGVGRRGPFFVATELFAMKFRLADDVRNEQLAVVGYPLDVNASSILGVLLNSKLDGAP